MIARTNEFKQEIAKLGKEIDFKIILYENDKIITEGSDFLMTEDNLNLIVEQINSAEIRETITSQDIYNVSVVRKGNLLSTMMKEIDFEIKQDLKLGEIVDCSFGLKVGNNYEYINYGKFIVYSKEYNEDTNTYSYVAFDSMMLSMIEVNDTSIIQGVTIKKAIENICEKVGLEVNITAEDITNLPNLNKTINESAFNNIEMTYRDVLDMICQALGVSMVVNDRELYLKTPSEVIDSEIKNVEGTSIEINDAINKELDEIKLYGDTQQNGTPTPDNPVDIQCVEGIQKVNVCGKNLFNKNAITSGYRLALNGTIVSDASYYVSEFIIVSENTEYIKNTLADAYHRFCFYNSNYEFISYSNNSSITTPNNCQYVRICGLLTELNNTQLEKGNQATTYEEYTGNTYEINLEGKNLLNATQESYTLPANTNTYQRIYDTKPYLEAGTKYYISYNIDNDSTSNTRSTPRLYLNREYVQSTMTNYNTTKGRKVWEFTPTVSGNYEVQYWLHTSNVDVTVSKFMISTSSDITYVPYRTPIKLYNGDYITGTPDNWSIYRENGRVVLNENNEWGTQSYGGNTYISGWNQHYFDNASTDSSNVIVLSDYFKTVSWNNRTQNIPNSMYINLSDTTRPRLEIRNSQWTSISDLQTWLSTHNTEVVYKLATPTTEAITDEYLISQLNALAQAQLYNGYNNISVSGNLPIYLKIKYYTKYELESFNEEYLKDKNVTFGEKYMINSVVLSRSEDNDNIYKRDEDSVALNGVHEFKIKDNLIMLYDDREDYIDEIYNQLNGLEFYINDFTSPGITYLEPLDIYNVVVGENIYKCLLLNDEIKIQQGLEENIYTEMPKETTTDYTIASKTDKEVSFIVDKQKGEINAKVSKGEVINEINLDESGAIINAEKISLEGKQIDLTTDNITIDSTNFSVDENGNMTCSNADITGGEINLTSSNETAKLKVISSSNQNSYIEISPGFYRTFSNGNARVIISNLLGIIRLNDLTNSNIHTVVSGGLITIFNQNNTQTINLDGNTGNITCVSLTQTSKEEAKKNFEKLKSGLEIINNTDIYKYNFNDEKDTDKKHIGLVIGDKYKYSKELTSKENDSVDIYSMVSVCFKAIQEQQEQINSLKEEIKKLKESDK